jgi:hypothetical protein
MLELSPPLQILLLLRVGGLSRQNTRAVFHLFAIVHWIRLYAPNREVAGSKSDKVNDFFSIYLILPSALRLVGYSASNRNDYEKLKNDVSEE